MRKSAVIFAVTLLVMVCSSGLGQETSSPLLDDLITEALSHNPSLQAARQNFAAAGYRVKQSKSIMPPRAGIEFYMTPAKNFPDPVKGSRENDYFIEQELPFWGRISSARDSAQNFAGMTEAQYHLLEREVIMQVKMAWYDLYFIGRKIGINEENEKLLQNFVEIARRQYELGMVNQADYLRGQTELLSLRKEALALEQERVAAESKLNALLGRTKGGFAPAGSIYSEAPEFTSAELLPLVNDNSPELKMARYNVAMNKAELGMARADYAPDLMLKGMYKDMVDMPEDFWSLMLGVTVPVAPWSLNQFSGKVKESEYNLKRSESEYLSAQNRLAAELSSDLARMKSGKATAALYKNDLVPLADQTLRSTISAYQNGKTEFLMVIDAFRMLQQSRADYEMAVMQYLSAQAELEKITGLSLEQIKGELK